MRPGFHWALAVSPAMTCAMKLVVALALLVGVLVQDAAAISSGYLALPGHFPHQALVRSVDFYTGKVDESSLCSGALIDVNWVLTSASCVKAGKDVLFQVTLGAFDLSLPSEESRQVVTVSNNIVHELYNLQTGQNDLALLQLPTPAQQNEFVAPIRLPSKAQANKSFLWWSAGVSGWGYVSANDHTEGNWVLRYFYSRVETNWWCRLRNRKDVTDNNICLWSFWKKGTCSGDSGDPVAVTDWDGKLVLVGIASRDASACANHLQPMFTRITPYLDWISLQTKIPLREK